MRPEGSLPHSQGDIFYIGEKIFPPAEHKVSAPPLHKVILAYHIFAQVCLVKYMSEYNDYLYNYR
jgi:hypothetical protein